jgi:holliday junction DNA helicase RuvA
MINYLKGKLVEKDPTYVVVDVRDIGYVAKISLHTYSAIKTLDETKLFTYLHIREDAHTLYGFADQAERKRFLDLISISGVGAATALMVLSSLSPDELHQAIVNERVNVIQGVKGIGLKTAQRIVLELKDKLAKEGLLDRTVELARPGNTLQNEALSALVTLGIPRATALKNIETVLNEHGGDMKLEDLIKQVLRRA